MARTTARVDGSTLVIAANDPNPITVGTDAWFAWLETATAFVFTSPAGHFTARKERRDRGTWYWKAYRTDHGVLHRAYLGKSPDLTLDQLTRAAATLTKVAPPVAPLPAQADALPPDHSPDPGHSADLSHANLLATKLFVPPARANLVARPRLFERIQAGLRDKLTLIAAPAGFGKTTLLSAWHATVAGGAWPFAWVALDSADNDRLRFWRYVIAALDMLAPGVGAPALRLLQSPEPPPLERILTSVLNAFSAATAGAPGHDVVLALDDYHVITTPAIHEMLAWLLDYLPPNLHLVILTRADPALPLARLRARGAMTELHANDLRFTPEEAASFLNQVMNLALTAADVAALEARTEGWIAGLQLAALAMRDHRDRSSFIHTFSGSNRYIVDYLAAEVLAAQPIHIQTFLLHTAILDRMCGALCDAVLGLVADNPSASHSTTSQLLLEDLERANLFVVPLDDERHWYRYHHLFAEVLRQRLTNGTPAAAIASLHRRASVWYARQGLVAEAVQHALTAADSERVADLIEQHGLRIIVGGQVHTVLRWLSALSDLLIRTRPMLCIIHALALLFTNQMTAAEARVQDAEHCIQPDTPTAQVHLIQGRAAAIRANIARYTGDLAGGVAYAQEVLRLLPETETIARTIALLHVARAFRVSGDVTEAAEQRASALIAPFQAADNLLGTLAAITNLARLQVLQGRLHAAAATYRELPQIAGSPDQPLLLEGPAYYVGMADLLYEWNDLDAAERHLAQAMEQLRDRLAVDAEDVTLGYLTLARLQHARGEYTMAALTLETYLDLARRRGFVAHLVARGVAVQAKLALAQGNLAAAVAWADASNLNVAADLHFPREAEYLILTRVWIAQADNQSDRALHQQALDLLARLLADATAKGRMGSVLDILIIRSLGQWTQGTHSDALATFTQALALATPQGYIRRFVDEGPAIRLLILDYADQGRGFWIAQQPPTEQNRKLSVYADELLAAFGKEQVNAGEALIAEQSALPRRALIQNQQSKIQNLVEPLSQRELEVLRLIAAGKSNAEIAQTLVIALSTVKTHTNSIFGQLQVTSRTQALARAHALQLI